MARKDEILIFCKQTAVRFKVSYRGLLPKKLKFQLSWPTDDGQCHLNAIILVLTLEVLLILGCNTEILGFCKNLIAFSYTSQIFLPTLEGNMLDKSKFHCMLNWSHIAAAIFKAGFGYVGFLTFQEGIYEIFICIFIVYYRSSAPEFKKNLGSRL